MLPNINMQFCRNQFLLRRWQVRCSSAGVWRHLGLMSLLSCTVLVLQLTTQTWRGGSWHGDSCSWYTVQTLHPLQGIVDGNPLQVLVATVFLLARFGLGFRVLQYGYVGADFPEPSGFSRHLS